MLNRKDRAGLKKAIGDSPLHTTKGITVTSGVLPGLIDAIDEAEDIIRDLMVLLGPSIGMPFELAESVRGRAKRFLEGSES